MNAASVSRHLRSVGFLPVAPADYRRQGLRVKDSSGRVRVVADLDAPREAHDLAVAARQALVGAGYRVEVAGRLLRRGARLKDSTRRIDTVYPLCFNTPMSATAPTPRLDRVEDGFARVVDADTGRTLGYVAREKSGSTRTGVTWYAHRLRTGSLRPLGSGYTRAEAVQVIVDYHTRPR